MIDKHSKNFSWKGPETKKEKTAVTIGTIILAGLAFIFGKKK